MFGGFVAIGPSVSFAPLVRGFAVFGPAEESLCCLVLLIERRCGVAVSLVSVELQATATATAKSEDDDDERMANERNSGSSSSR